MLRSSWARSGSAAANDKTAIAAPARLQVKKDLACSAKLELLNLRDFINNLLDLIPVLATAPTERVAICSLRLTCTLPIVATGGLGNPVLTSRGVRERPDSQRKRIGTDSVGAAG